MDNLKRKTPWILWICLLLSLTFYQFLFGFEYAGYRYPENNFPTFRVNETGTPDCSNEFSAIQSAIQTWNNVNTTYTNFQYGSTTTTTALAYDGTNLIRWVESGWDDIFPEHEDAIAVNSTWISGSTAYESDIFFNGEDYLWSDNGTANRYDVQNISTHEIGHSVGLDDLYGGGDTEKTMYGYAGTGETKKSSLHSDDEDGARYVNFDPQLSGTLSESQKWIVSLEGSEIELTDNITIPANYTLTIAPNISIQIPSNKKITVSGVLSADGSYNDEITFQAQSGTWYGIEVSNTGSFNPSYCNFEDAQYPIKYYDSEGDIEHCDFTGYTRAVKYENYASGRIQYSAFIEYNQTGIEYVQYADGDIRSYNQIQDHYYGIKIDNTSTTDAGTYAGQGYNSIFNVMYDIYSTNTATINAQYNYWGGGDPSIYGNVLWEPALDEDPSEGLKKRNSRMAIASNLRGDINDIDTLGFNEFDQAHLLYLEGKTEEALARFQELEERYPAHNVGRQSLAFEYRILRKAKRVEEAQSRMLTISSNHADQKIAGVAASIQVGLLLRDGDYQQALSMAAAVVAKFPGTDLEKYSLYDLGTIYWYYLNDPKIGENYYRKLIEKYPNDDLTISALSTLGEWTPKAPEEEPLPKHLDVAQAISDEYILYQNYPNPFNLVTEIGYHLPQASQVVVVIFDGAGREVSKLIDREEQAGYHKTIWNASNLPSGVYFYKMQAGNFVAKNKLLLLK